MTGSRLSRARYGRSWYFSSSRSYSDPSSRHCSRPGHSAAGNTECSTAIGRPLPSRTRRISATGSPSASSSAAATAGPALRAVADSTRAPATMPCRRSCSENPASVVRSCSSLPSATNVPPLRPTVRTTRPRRARLASACRSVIRLTPSQPASACSVGIRSPGSSWPAAIASASHSSICPCRVLPGSRTITGGARPISSGSPGRGCGCPPMCQPMYQSEGSAVPGTRGASSPSGATTGANSLRRPTAR